MMTVSQAIVLGLVQGLGEFLPISSSAHLALVPWVAGWQDPGLAVDVALHLGTLVALLVYFRQDLVRLGRALWATARERRIGDDLERRLSVLVLIGCVPGVLAGMALEHKAEAAFRAPWLIACALVVMGGILYLADRLAARARPIAALGLRDALLIGCAQAAAIVPGVSRSGSTITAARLLGLDREAAARFSFLLAIPITAGAAAYKLLPVLAVEAAGRVGLEASLGPAMGKLAPKHADFVAAGGFQGTTVLAIVVAGVSGYLAIAWLLRSIRTSSYLPFALYRFAVGAAVLGLFFARG
jgi:undecaprenyl-diphosphatase